MSCDVCHLRNVVAAVNADAVERVVLEFHIHEQDGHLVAAAAGFGASGLGERLKGDGQGGAGGRSRVGTAAALRPTRGGDFRFGLFL
jgi:hypothetical protein